MEKRKVLSYHEFFYEKLGDDQFFAGADNKPYNMYFERPAMIEELPDLKGKNVLDAGAAAGWYSGYLIGLGANVTALDISPNMIHLIKLRLGDQVRTIQCDLSKGLDFLKDSSFDFILSSLTLDYVEDWDYVMCEFSRVLKPGGGLLFSVEHPYDNFSSNHMDTYFETIYMGHESVEDGETVSVWYYKRPLQEMVMPVIRNGFEIEKLKEPKPDKKFADVYPDLYEFYMRRPEYLIIKARKKHYE